MTTIDPKVKLAIEPNEIFLENKYMHKLMRDVIAGPDKIKRENELYLPMPPSMRYEVGEAAAHPNHLTANFAPWAHNNPVYSAYLMRARFPDISSGALRSMTGIATRTAPSFEMPEKFENYLTENFTDTGKTIYEAFESVVGEVCTVAKTCLVLDWTSGVDPKFYVSIMVAESNINWHYEKDSTGKKKLSSVSFILGTDANGKDLIKNYCLEDGKAVVREYLGDVQIGDDVPLIYRGTALDFIPVFPVGVVENDFENFNPPIRPIADIAVSIYQRDADLAQAHFLSCNPTLFVFGANAQERPTVVGSNIVVTIQNPNGRAEYPNTDTSALDHVSGYIKDLYLEAASYGANLISSSTSKESGMALSLKQSEKGVTLVGVVLNVSEVFNKILKTVGKLSRMDEKLFSFSASTEFAETILTAQEVTALTSSWLNGAIDHDTLLNAMRKAGYIDSEMSNEDIKKNILIDFVAEMDRASDNQEDENLENEQENS